MSQAFDAARHPAQVAPDLLGWTLVCRGTAAVLVELEAYHQDEPAAHSFGGLPTPRTEHLFGAPGTIYVYFTYGMHWCANLVTGAEGSGEAVLFRGAVPVHGEQLMRERRSERRGSDPAKWRIKEIAGGPGRLTQALDIRAGDSGVHILRDDLTLEAALDVAEAGPVLVRDIDAAALAGIALPTEGPLAQERVVAGPRIGITRAVDLPWRFGVRGSAGLSRGF